MNRMKFYFILCFIMTCNFPSCNTQMFIVLHSHEEKRGKEGLNVGTLLQEMRSPAACSFEFL